MAKPKLGVRLYFADRARAHTSRTSAQPWVIRLVTHEQVRPKGEVVAPRRFLNGSCPSVGGAENARAWGRRWAEEPHSELPPGTSGSVKRVFKGRSVLWSHEGTDIFTCETPTSTCGPFLLIPLH